ncbi:MAG TPA: rod shape-determining protein MreD [Amaricoccus sp.]|nr:rod shape-determining protein MreD [Amaricoccus sp.]
MTVPRVLPGGLETPVMVGLGTMAILAVTMPLGPGGELVAPDLLYCLLVAWVVRRPARTPLLAVVALGLLADVLLSRPIGLGALALMLVVEAFRRRAILFHGAPFVLEWAAAVAGFALMLAGMRLALALVFVEPPGVGLLARYLLATAIAYPLVVLGLAWCLRLRAPRAASGYRPGRVR